MEVWKSIAEGYEVSNLGNIKSLRRKVPKIIKQFNYGGYPYAVLRINGKYERFAVHRLVAQIFIPNPEGKPQVNHINGIKTDNRVENLEWVTPAENARHALQMGLSPQGETHTMAKITNAQAVFIREVYVPRDVNFGAKALADKFNVAPAVIKRIIHGVGYKKAGGKFHPKYRVPDNIRDEIRHLYKRGVRGYGSASLAKIFGLTKTTVQRILKENRQEQPQPHGLG